MQVRKCDMELRYGYFDNEPIEIPDCMNDATWEALNLLSTHEWPVTVLMYENQNNKEQYLIAKNKQNVLSLQDLLIFKSQFFRKELHIKYT